VHITNAALEGNQEFPYPHAIVDCSRLPYIAPATKPPSPLDKACIGKVSTMNADSLVGVKLTLHVIPTRPTKVG
jgi:hypothetical protein